MAHTGAGTATRDRPDAAVAAVEARLPRPAGPRQHANVSFTGCPDAAKLCTEVACNPAAAIGALVIGAGGTGKTALLDTLARLWTAAGIPVHRDPTHRGDPTQGDCVWLVDDARNLPDDVLIDLARRSGLEDIRLVVAARPGPSRPTLDTLAALIGRARPPVVLGRLDQAATRARVAALRPQGVDPVLADWIGGQTGGNPRLINMLTVALRDAGCLPDGPGAGWIPGVVPTAVLEQIRLEVDLLGPDAGALLHALAVGADPQPDLLGAVLDIGATRLEHAAADAAGSGLLTDSGGALPIVRLAVRALTPPVRLQALRARLAAVVLDKGGALLPYAQEFAGVGAVGREVAAVLVAGAGEAADPRLTASLLAEAVRAGAPVESVAARMARASAMTGDLSQALRLADRAICEPGAPDRDVAVTVAAAVLAGRGMLSRSAALHRWFAAGAPVSPAAVPALLGTGDLAGAMDALTHPGGTPTLSDGVETLLAEGLLESITGTPSAALSKLMRAAALLEPGVTRTLLSDTPAALAAVVALNCGEFGVAESVLARAVAIGLGGEFARSRHQVLQAWIAMQRGDLDGARLLLAAPGPGGGDLEPREELAAAAIEVGIARRDGNIGALSVAWTRARQAIVRHPVDLFTLHALGELSVAAARLQEESWVAPHLAEAWTLLERLGEPPLWAAPMHWYAVQAAGLADRADDAAVHVAKLDAAAQLYPQARVLAGAARCWLRVLAGHIDSEEVSTAARRLHAIGHAWDASRLAGQAAVRAEDRAVMTALLSCARSLRPAGGSTVADPGLGPEPGAARRPATAGSPASVEPTVPGPQVPITSRAGDHPGLSEREREVAALFVEGLTYKEIGARLFISAKTVEHHVARIRHRCGATSRGDLFARLRVALSQSERI